jgi:Protein of unknown function (DUF742).
MMVRRVDREDPDRLYTVTRGRTRARDSALDAVSLVAGVSEPTPGMQSEHARILRLTKRPMAVAELAARMRLPMSVVKILICDLRDAGQVTVRHPSSARAGRPDTKTLKQVLVALQDL